MFIGVCDSIRFFSGDIDILILRFVLEGTRCFFIFGRNGEVVVRGGVGRVGFWMEMNGGVNVGFGIFFLMGCRVFWEFTVLRFCFMFWCLK